jgi:protein-disulfide isomerase
MAKTIQVYVMDKEVTTKASLDGRTLAAALEARSRTHDCLMKEISKTEKVISEEDKAALKLVKELAAEKNLRFQVIDVASLRGKLRARLKGVKATPTIIVDNNRLTGVPKKEEFEALLKGI